MEEIIVSIICNTYNHGKYIAQALDGFLMQKTSFRFEVLIHDDASTDDTAKIIKTYENKYPNIIKPIYEVENQYKQGKIFGVKQYSRAKGKFIAFCEGDDYWIDQYKLQKQVDFLEKNPSYIGCVHKYIVVDENGEQHDTKTFGYYENEGDYSFNDFFSKELPSQLASLVFRNIYFDPVKGYPASFVDVGIQGDIKLFLWLLTFGDIYRMSETMSAYRFVIKKGYNSWSSRTSLSANGYNNYKNLKKMELVYKKEYSKKIVLKNRKKAAIKETIFDFRKKHTFGIFARSILFTLIHPLIVCEMAIKKICKMLMVK